MSACQCACNYLKKTEFSLSLSVNVKVLWSLVCDKFQSSCYISCAEIFTLDSYALWGVITGNNKSCNSCRIWGCHLLTRWFAELFFDPEDGGNTILRNVGCNSTDYTASYPRRWYSSCNSCLQFWNARTRVQEKANCIICLWIRLRFSNSPTSITSRYTTQA
jgi:hypothetical protein